MQIVGGRACDGRAEVYSVAGGGPWVPLVARIEDALLVAEVNGHHQSALEALAALTLVTMLRGDLSTAAIAARQLTVRGHDPSVSPVRLWGQGLGAEVLLRQGRPDEALEALDVAEAAAGRTGPSEILWIHGLQASALTQVGRHAESEAVAAGCHRLFRRASPESWFTIAGTVAVAETDLALGWSRSSESLRALRRLARKAPVAEPVLLVLSGARARARGDHRSARRLLERAVDQAAARELPHERARAHRGLGALLETRDPAASARHLLTARDLAERLRGSASTPDTSGAA